MRFLVALALASMLLLPACGGGGDGGVRTENGTKLLLFAVDSANWNMLTPMVENGELPTISRLLNEGSFGILKTGEPIQSPQMWTSIATGVTPERHGIETFVVKLPNEDRMVPVSSNLRKVKAFWNILSERDVTVGVVAWWPSWPAEKVNGFIVSQRAWPVQWSPHGVPFGATRDEYGRLVVEDFPGRTYPEGLYDRFEKYIVTEEDLTARDWGRFFGDLPNVDPVVAVDAMWVYAKDKSFADGGLALLQEMEPEVFAIFFQGTDVVSHYYWGYQTDKGYDVSEDDERRYGDVVRGYYKYVDEAMGRFIEAVGPNCAVVMVSDHGFETKDDLKVRWERGEEVRTKEGNKDVPWDHGVDGAFVFKGPGIKSGHSAADASVVDVTPTLLAYLGLPTAEDMDGRPMLDIFEPEFLAEHPVEYVPTYETGDRTGNDTPMESPLDEGMKEKLRALGYIE